MYISIPKEDNKEHKNKGEGKEDQSHEEGDNLLVDLLNMLKLGFQRKAYLKYQLRERAT